MIHWKTLFYIIIGVVAFTSCNNDDDPLGGAGEIEDTAYLRIELNDIQYYLSDHLPGESTIRSAAFHVFNDDGSRDEKTPYIYIQKESNVFTFGVTPGKKKIVVTANYSSGHMNEYDITYFPLVLKNTIINNPTGNPSIANDICSYFTGIPMNGQGEVTAVKGELRIMPVEVKRMLSRIDAPTTEGTIVELSPEEKQKLEEQTGKTFGNNLTFKLESHILINGGYRYAIFPDYGVEDEFDRWTKWFQPLYIESVYKNGQLVSAYSGKKFLENNEHVYVYENSPRTTYTDLAGSYNASKVYAFILCGELSDEKGTSAVRYWRANIAKNAIYNGKKVATYQILRNAIYKTNILKVLTAGHETPEEAEKEIPWIPIDGEATIETEVSIIHWKQHYGNTDM